MAAPRSEWLFLCLSPAISGKVITTAKQMFQDGFLQVRGKRIRVHCLALQFSTLKTTGNVNWLSTRSLNSFFLRKIPE
jgi:hypothetical protein